MSGTSIHVNIQIPAFGYAPKVGERRAYSQALCAEIHAAAEELSQYRLSSLHITGAAELEEKGLEQVLILLHKEWNLAGTKKSVSLSPEKITTSNMTIFRNFHFHRFYIDFGAFNALDFARLQRPYSRQVNLSLEKLLGYYDMHNICAEIACGLTGQTEKTLAETLNRLLALQPEAIRLCPVKRDSLLSFGRDWLTSHGYYSTADCVVAHPARPGYTNCCLPASSDDARQAASENTGDHMSAPAKAASENTRGELPDPMAHQASGTPAASLCRPFLPRDCLGIGCGAVSCLDGGLIFNTNSLNTYLLHAGELDKLIVAVEPPETAVYTTESVVVFQKLP